MTPDQITLVQESFEKVKPIAPQAGAMFYDRLFTIAPQVKPLFKGNMDEQGEKLMATLAAVVAGLKNLDIIVPIAENLAKRHVTYGVREEHYAYVGEALLWTLEQGLGKDYTPETRAAWEDAYKVLSGVMIDASKK